MSPKIAKAGERTIRVMQLTVNRFQSLGFITEGCLAIGVVCSNRVNSGWWMVDSESVIVSSEPSTVNHQPSTIKNASLCGFLAQKRSAIVAECRHRDETLRWVRRQWIQRCEWRRA
jgi:hypothetical protein